MCDDCYDTAIGSLVEFEGRVQGFIEDLLLMTRDSPPRHGRDIRALAKSRRLMDAEGHILDAHGGRVGES